MLVPVRGNEAHCLERVSDVHNGCADVCKDTNFQLSPYIVLAQFRTKTLIRRIVFNCNILKPMKSLLKT